RCPANFSDGMNIDYRSDTLDIAECLQLIHDQLLRYDVILVDSFHEYAPSLRDLEAAWTILGERGTIIVHDCNPESEEVASPSYRPVTWSGVTYKAYLDFVTGPRELEYFTVDTDHGCGVITRKGDLRLKPAHEPWNSRERDGLIERWREIGDDFRSAFQFLQAYKAQLLNLMSVNEFLRAEQPDQKTMSS